MILTRRYSKMLSVSADEKAPLNLEIWAQQQSCTDSHRTQSELYLISLDLNRVDCTHMYTVISFFFYCTHVYTVIYFFFFNEYCCFVLFFWHYSLKHPLFEVEQRVVFSLHNKTFSSPGAALLLSYVHFSLSFGKWPHCVECSAEIFISSHVMAGHSCIHTKGFSNIRSETQRGCPEQTIPGTFLSLKTGYYKQNKNTP